MPPHLFISGWEPGTKEHDKVRVSENIGAHATRPYLIDLPLWQAKQIVAAFDLLRSLEMSLRNKSLDSSTPVS